MKPIALLALLCAGCYDLNSLGSLYAPDLALTGDDGTMAHDLAIPADQAADSGSPPEDLATGADDANPSPIDLAVSTDRAIADLAMSPDLACPGGTAKCLGVCVNLQLDTNHCGACNTPCAMGMVCSAGVCGASCKAPLLQCMGQPGCIDPRSDPNNCSGCGQVCPMIGHGTPGCTGSVCGVGACAFGYGDCDKNPANGCEVNLLGDLANCGVCGKVCPSVSHGSAGCTSGACGIAACDNGFGDCDQSPQNGCETPLAADLSNCGACGKVCPMVANGTRVCSGGACGIGACSAGFGNCDGNAQNGCEANLRGDPNNCGNCGMVCPAVANGVAGCSGALCGIGACNANWGDCDLKANNGCEANLQTDPANCGKCGNACGGSCTNGACAAWSAEISGTNVALQCVWGVNANEVYAVGGIGKVDHTTNAGVTWIVKVLTPQLMANQWLYGVWGSASNDVYIVGDSTILRSTDQGANWLAQTSPVDESYHAVWGSGPNDIYIVGTTGTILHSINSGATWTRQTSGTIQNLLGVWGTAGGREVWAVGGAGTILHTANSGATWTVQTSPNADDLWGVWGTSASNVYAVGDAGTLLHATGGAWSAQKSGTNQLLTGIWGSSASDIYITGWGGTILHSGDGTNWAAEASGTGNTLNSVWGSGASDVYVVGAMGGILHHM